MKKVFIIVMGVMMFISMTACSVNEGISKPEQNEHAKENEAQSTKSGKILIVYFTSPGEADMNDIDAMSSASVIKEEDKVIGNTQFVAACIQKYTNADTFQIETVQQYPKDHDALIDIAAEEQENGKRPQLSSSIENLTDYETIFIGYPNWWADLPMPVYTFFDLYDLSGKTIIPFVTHGGSGFSNTIEQLSQLEPNAKIVENGLNLARDEVLNASPEIKTWIETLGL